MGRSENCGEGIWGCRVEGIFVCNYRIRKVLILPLLIVREKQVVAGKVFLKRFVLLYTLHLPHAELILRHSESCPKIVLLSSVSLNLSRHYFALPPFVHLRLHLESVRLIQLLILLITHDIFEVFV